MKADFETQAIVRSKIPITWEDFLREIETIKAYCIYHGLNPEDFCITDDPSEYKEIRLDIGLEGSFYHYISNTEEGEIYAHLRTVFGKLYFIIPDTHPINK